MLRTLPSTLLRSSTLLAVLGLAAVLGTAGCSCSDETGSPDGGPGRLDGSTGMPDGWIRPNDGALVVRDGGVVVMEDGGASWVCYQVVCDGHLTECGDCMDNDGDGRIDSRDPECLGPCDNTEGPALLAGIGGETGGPCRADCYFDFGNGPGNDDCFWDHRCDPHAVAPSYDPEGMACPYEESRVGSRDCPDTQSDTCLEVCRPLTPNGCDCFGCCTFDELSGRAEADGGEWVWIGSVLDGTNTGTCTFEDVTDTTACRPCMPVDGCFNDCGRCELCIGRDTIPADCYPPPDAGPYDAPYDGGPPEYRCEPGVQLCGLPGEADCPTDYYCITGCCRPTLI